MHVYVNVSYSEQQEKNLWHIADCIIIIIITTTIIVVIIIVIVCLRWGAGG